MAKRGRKFTFHGAFASRLDAKNRCRRVGQRAFIKRIKVRGQTRHVVMTKRKA